MNYSELHSKEHGDEVFHHPIFVCFYLCSPFLSGDKGSNKTGKETQRVPTFFFLSFFFFFFVSFTIIGTQVKKSFPCCKNISCDPPVCTRYPLFFYQHLILLSSFWSRAVFFCFIPIHPRMKLGGKMRTIEWPCEPAAKAGIQYITSTSLNH